MEGAAVGATGREVVDVVVVEGAAVGATEQIFVSEEGAAVGGTPRGLSHMPHIFATSSFKNVHTEHAHSEALLV